MARRSKKLIERQKYTRTKRLLSIVPTTEEVLRTLGFPALPTIGWTHDDADGNEFERGDLVNALVFACRYNEMLEAKVAELEVLFSPRVPRDLQSLTADAH